jgi:hypothetical protein
LFALSAVALDCVKVSKINIIIGFESMFKFHITPRVSTAFFVIIMAVSQPTMSQALSNQMDIRVLIDVSGSMKKTDPNNLRIPALQVLTQVLPTGSKAGVWQFSNTPKVIVPHGVIDAQWQQQASVAAQNISSTGQFTDIGAALKVASFSAQDQAQGRQLHVILLTDGMVDVSKDVAENKRARRALLEPILQQYIDAGARVHTIGLSHEADEATLSAMAQRTDGLFEVAVHADQLLDIFLRALDNTVITQQVPVKFSEQSFLVQQGVESMTIVVEKNGDEQIKLKDGKQRILGQQQTLTNQQWQSSSTHDVIIIKNPTPGTWALISDTATLKRINVVGQLQILLQQSHQNIKVGQRSYLDVQLANEKGHLLSAEQLQGFQLEVTMNHANKEVFKQQQVFVEDEKTRMHLPVLNDPGMYDLTISVTNGELMRTINRSLRVHPLVVIQQIVATKQNTTSVPVTQELAVITETSSNPVSLTDTLVVSNETASPELQALMEGQNTTVVAAEPPAPETATSQVANLVNKLKNKVISPIKTTLVTPEAAVKENTGNTQTSQPEATSSVYWRWLFVGGAGLVLLLLLVILRRTSKAVR